MAGLLCSHYSIHFPSREKRGPSLLSHRECMCSVQRMGSRGTLARPLSATKGPLTEYKCPASGAKLKGQKKRKFFYFCESSLSSFTKTWRNLSDHKNHFYICLISADTILHHPPAPSKAVLFQIGLPSESELLFLILQFSFCSEKFFGFAGGLNILDMSEFQV